MTPFGRIVRNAIQKIAGAFYDGPKAPDRLSMVALDFANLYPQATRQDWLDFARRFGATCYQEGYIRGWEQSERDPEPPWRELPPEVVMDEIDPDWRWSPAFGAMLADPGAIPEGLIDEPQEMEEPTKRKGRKRDAEDQ